VLACAPGRVVFAGDRIVTGNTIVLEHLPSLFSIYMHLSAISVAEGDLLAAGELLGRVGSTGLSTGPHLHWELRVGPQSVNPEYWLSRPILDKTWLSGGF
jgi:murein DD-endopeptidase MepM/ murein hydrolase activator NlpD